MQQFCQYGSVRGAASNRRPYRDHDITHDIGLHYNRKKISKIITSARSLLN